MRPKRHFEELSCILPPRFRTDSETTDEQCLPESVSTANDSALDSAEEDETQSIIGDEEIVAVTSGMGDGKPERRLMSDIFISKLTYWVNQD